MKFYNIICTFFGIGNIKFAPGTFGSLVAFPIWVLLYPILNLGIIYFACFWILLLIFLFFLGVHCSDIYTKETGKEDASQIVIDEVVGQLISLFLSFSLIFVIFRLVPSANEIFWIFGKFPILYFLSNFIFFRLFDIFKISLVRYCDRNIKNGLGVMLDDVVAGVFSALTIIIISFLSSLLRNL